MREVSIYDGKYTFVMNEDGTIAKILRHGEAWPAAETLIYSGVILALVQEVEESREESEWIRVTDKEPDYSEPIVYGRLEGDGRWSVGIAYRTVSEKWNPEMESTTYPGGFTHWKRLGRTPS